MKTSNHSFERQALHQTDAAAMNGVAVFSLSSVEGGVNAPQPVIETVP